MTLNQQKKSPFSKSFFMISLITIAALIGLGIKEFSNRKAQLDAHFSSYCESTANRLGTILTTPLWNFELDRFKVIAQVEMQDNQLIQSISVFEKTIVSDKQLLFCITKDDSGQLVNCQSSSSCTNTEKVRDLIKNNLHIGTLNICFSQKTIDQQKQSLLQEVLFNMILLLVIVIAGLFMASRSLVK